MIFVSHNVVSEVNVESAYAKRSDPQRDHNLLSRGTHGGGGGKKGVVSKCEQT